MNDRKPRSPSRENQLRHLATVILNAIIFVLPAMAPLAVLIEPAPGGPLSDRAREVAEALDKAGRMVQELEAEVRARTEIIEALAAETKDAEQRADQAVERAAMSEKAAKAVDAFLDRALENRIGSFEQSARRREWGLATVVAFIVGIICILVSHYGFGF